MPHRSESSVSLKCYAKVNLILGIYAKSHSKTTSPSLHSIDSLFHSISLYDEMKIEKRFTTKPKKNLTEDKDNSDIRLVLSKSSSSPVPLKTKKYDLTRDNILVKIYQFMQKKYGLAAINVSLKKRIPVGAGLGGGSSNAASLIVGLDRLFGLSLSYEEMTKIASRFGSDIPFFLQGGMAWVGGTGDKVHYFNNSFMLNADRVGKHAGTLRGNELKGQFLLLYPNFFISTAEAYKENVSYAKKNSFSYVKKKLFQLDEQKGGDAKLKMSHLILNSIYNSFQEKTLKTYSKLNRFYEIFNKETNFVSLSGTGSCMFAYFNDIIIADKVYSLLEDKTKFLYKIDLVDKGFEFE